MFIKKMQEKARERVRNVKAGVLPLWKAMYASNMKLLEDEIDSLVADTVEKTIEKMRPEKGCCHHFKAKGDKCCDLHTHMIKDYNERAEALINPITPKE